MSTTFTWKINNIERLTETHNSLSNIVTSITWELEAVTDDNNYCKDWGIQQVPHENLNPETFIEYSDITEAQAISWVISAINEQNDDLKGDHSTFVDYLKASLQYRLDNETYQRFSGTPW